MIDANKVTFYSPPLSPHGASLFITIKAFCHYGSYRLVYLIHDSIEQVIQRIIEGAQRMIGVNNSSQREEESEIIKINPAMKRYFELEIKTLQNAPRDADKLRRLLEIKQGQKDEAMHIEDTQRG